MTSETVLYLSLFAAPLLAYALVKFVTDLLIFAGDRTYLPFDRTSGGLEAEPRSSGRD